MFKIIGMLKSKTSQVNMFEIKTTILHNLTQ